MIWRSSTMGLAAEHCGRAIDYLIEGRPYDRARFAAGVAAHACIEEIGRAASVRGIPLDRESAELVTLSVAEDLIANGRSFDGRPEPPLPSESVWAGRRLALGYHEARPSWPTDSYEHVLFVDREWRPVAADDPAAWLCAAIDVLGVREPSILDDEDELEGPVAYVADFKSAWSAKAEELSTIQRKIQACLAWAHRGSGAQGVRVEILNLRLKASFTLTLQGEDVEPELAKYRREIEGEIAARERVGPDGLRVASPGAGCIGCPYLESCEPAREILSAETPLGDPQELAVRWTIHRAEADRLQGVLKPLVEEEPIDLPDGRLLGWKPGEETRLKADAYQALAGAWIQRHGGNVKAEDRDAVVAASIPGLVKSLGVTKAGAEKLATALFHEGLDDFRQKRAAFLAGIEYRAVARKWAAWKEGEPGKAKKKKKAELSDSASLDLAYEMDYRPNDGDAI